MLRLAIEHGVPYQIVGFVDPYLVWQNLAQIQDQIVGYVYVDHKVRIRQVV